MDDTSTLRKGSSDTAAEETHLCPDHGSALRDAAQGLAEVSAATDEGNLEVVLVYVVLVVCWSQHLHMRKS